MTVKYQVILKISYIYILTNKNKSTLYIGVTSDLQRRIAEHNEGIGSKFTQKYALKHLVYYEKFDNITEAIHREKQLKRWSRLKKEELIIKLNPDWEFLEKDYS